jgi:hypothetical protein
MATETSSAYRAVAIGVLMLLVAVCSACSDDPILGPSDGESEDGGSYGVIKRLSRPATAGSTATAGSAAASDSTATLPPEAPLNRTNPERF